MRWAVVLSVLVACDFPTPSEDYACRVTADCESGRVCEIGYCVIGSGNGPDAFDPAPVDAAADALAPDADPFEAVKPQCIAAGYAQASSGGYYRTVTSGASWLAAEADCAGDVIGATHLVVLSSAAEVTYVGTLLGWVGLSDRAVEGQFVNITGEAGDLRPWATGQPDNGGGNENCAQMKTAAGLDDDQCGNAHRYTCECDGRAPTP